MSLHQVLRAVQTSAKEVPYHHHEPMNNPTDDRASIDPLRDSSDLRNVFVREAKAAAMGVSLKHYEFILRQIGCDYSD